MYSQVTNNCNVFRELDWTSSAPDWQSRTICGALCLIRITYFHFPPFELYPETSLTLKTNQTDGMRSLGVELYIVHNKMFHRTSFRASSICCDSTYFGCNVDNVMATAVYVFEQTESVKSRTSRLLQFWNHRQNDDYLFWGFIIETTECRR